MEFNPTVSKLAVLLSDLSRSRILICLMDGRYHSAGELALAAKIKPQTASFHLKKIAESGIIKVKNEGRHRFYSLKDAESAAILESFLAISPTPAVNSFNQTSSKKTIKLARTCYDHLAGELGVKITRFLIHNKFLLEADEKNYLLSEDGKDFFKDFGIEVDEQKNKRRAFARKCLDWTEREYHLAGALGNSIITRMFELQWFQRRKDTRALRLTDKGKCDIHKVFNINIE
ncbi:winged helix-turn-helix transcriptional regulator [Bacillus sp. WMMC1349]|uniref:ArsR/SmtB family transcription factor n=1 Tax=Bacillus sp. WMMC1349 TaxID=2736254 RepID=UPI00155526C7|nr:winged helix-turn-helix domain-containing protein [Bacillus sp. WMMC1349]NPC91579.1 winged helix-turn-helix transcriptional regulator [Bacillus sp. WMMC1349]